MAGEKRFHHGSRLVVIVGAQMPIDLNHHVRVAMPEQLGHAEQVAAGADQIAGN
jgi:hypothetical protein